ncbi:hypothetical protein ACCO45_001203 [Purpureocillium lilacinum]|uniref:Uncharacterized protein n=1 Tax=Purpureocillium lilacinum TaxID=33203 RepID=A0ACC4E8Z4_PURLI
MARANLGRMVAEPRPPAPKPHSQPGPGLIEIRLSTASQAHGLSLLDVRKGKYFDNGLAARHLWFAHGKCSYGFSPSIPFCTAALPGDQITQLTALQVVHFDLPATVQRVIGGSKDAHTIHSLETTVVRKQELQTPCSLVIKSDNIEPSRQHPLPRILPQDPSRTSSSLDVFKLVLRKSCDVLKPGRLGVPSRARIQAPQLRQDATKLCPNSGACRHMRTNMAKPGASSLHWLAAMRVSSKLNPGGESQPGERGFAPRGWTEASEVGFLFRA